jgi:hypothetical protein
MLAMADSVRRTTLIVKMQWLFADTQQRGGVGDVLRLDRKQAIPAA